jgi:hypothetical protein
MRSRCSIGGTSAPFSPCWSTSHGIGSSRPIPRRGVRCGATGSQAVSTSTPDRAAVAVRDRSPQAPRAAASRGPPQVSEERDYPEIASAVGTSEQAVRQRVSRALSWLRKANQGERAMSDYFDRIERHLLDAVERHASSRTARLPGTTKRLPGLRKPRPFDRSHNDRRAGITRRRRPIPGIRSISQAATSTQSDLVKSSVRRGGRTATLPRTSAEVDALDRWCPAPSTDAARQPPKRLAPPLLRSSSLRASLRERCSDTTAFPPARGSHSAPSTCTRTTFGGGGSLPTWVTT